MAKKRNFSDPDHIEKYIFGPSINGQPARSLLVALEKVNPKLYRVMNEQVNLRTNCDPPRPPKGCSKAAFENFIRDSFAVDNAEVGRINRRAEAKGLDLKVLKLTFSGGCMEILELNKEIDLRCPAGPTIGSSPSKLKIGIYVLSLIIENLDSQRSLQFQYQQTLNSYSHLPQLPNHNNDVSYDRRDDSNRGQSGLNIDRDHLQLQPNSEDSILDLMIDDLSDADGFIDGSLYDPSSCQPVNHQNANNTFTSAYASASASAPTFFAEPSTSISTPVIPFWPVSDPLFQTIAGPDKQLSNQGKSYHSNGVNLPRKRLRDDDISHPQQIPQQRYFDHIPQLPNCDYSVGGNGLCVIGADGSQSATYHHNQSVNNISVSSSSSSSSYSAAGNAASNSTVLLPFDILSGPSLQPIASKQLSNHSEKTGLLRTAHVQGLGATLGPFRRGTKVSTTYPMSNIQSTYVIKRELYSDEIAAYLMHPSSSAGIQSTAPQMWQPRVAVLTGAGGIGKSTLALHTGLRKDIQNLYTGGVYSLDCSALSPAAYAGSGVGGGGDSGSCGGGGGSSGGVSGSGSSSSGGVSGSGGSGGSGSGSSDGGYGAESATLKMFCAQLLKDSQYVPDLSIPDPEQLLKEIITVLPQYFSDAQPFLLVADNVQHFNSLYTLSRLCVGGGTETGAPFGSLLVTTRLQAPDLHVYSNEPVYPSGGQSGNATYWIDINAESDDDDNGRGLTKASHIRARMFDIGALTEGETLQFLSRGGGGAPWCRPTVAEESVIQFCAGVPLALRLLTRGKFASNASWDDLEKLLSKQQQHLQEEGAVQPTGASLHKRTHTIVRRCIAVALELLDNAPCGVHLPAQAETLRDCLSLLLLLPTGSKASGSVLEALWGASWNRIAENLKNRSLLLTFSKPPRPHTVSSLAVAQADSAENTYCLHDHVRDYLYRDRQQHRQQLGASSKHIGSAAARLLLHLASLLVIKEMGQPWSDASFIEMIRYEQCVSELIITEGDCALPAPLQSHQQPLLSHPLSLSAAMHTHALKMMLSCIPDAASSNEDILGSSDVRTVFKAATVAVQSGCAVDMYRVISLCLYVRSASDLLFRKRDMKALVSFQQWLNPAIYLIDQCIDPYAISAEAYGQSNAHILARCSSDPPTASTGGGGSGVAVDGGINGSAMRVLLRVEEQLTNEKAKLLEAKGISLGFGSDMLDESVECLKLSVKLRGDLHTTYSASVANCLNTLALVYLYHFRKRSSAGEDGRYVCWHCTYEDEVPGSEAKFCRRCEGHVGLLEKAGEALMEISVIWETLADCPGSAAVCHCDRGVNNNNMGLLWLLYRRPMKALQCFSEAKVCYEQGRAELAFNPNFLVGLSGNVGMAMTCLAAPDKVTDGAARLQRAIDYYTKRGYPASFIHLEKFNRELKALGDRLDRNNTV